MDYHPKNVMKMNNLSSVGHIKPNLFSYINFITSSYTLLKRPSSKLSKNISVMLFHRFSCYVSGEELPLPLSQIRHRGPNIIYKTSLNR